MKSRPITPLLPLLLLLLMTSFPLLRAQDGLEEIDDFEEFDDFEVEGDPVTSAIITHNEALEMAESVFGYWDADQHTVVITINSQTPFEQYQLVVRLYGGQGDLAGSYNVVCRDEALPRADLTYWYDMEEFFDMETFESVGEYSKSVSSSDCETLADKSITRFTVTKSVPFEEEVSGIWGATSVQTGFYLDLEGEVSLHGEALGAVKTFKVMIRHLRVAKA